MQNFDINSLLDDIKSRHELKSDYKLSLFLGVTDGSIRNFRHGRSLPDERICGLLANAAGIDPLILAAQVQAQRSKTEEARSLWAMVAERLQMVPQALAAAMFAVLFATSFVASDAHASSACGMDAPQNDTVTKLYIVSIISIRHHDLAQILFQKSATSSNFNQQTN